MDEITNGMKLNDSFAELVARKEAEIQLVRSSGLEERNRLRAAISGLETELEAGRAEIARLTEQWQLCAAALESAGRQLNERDAEIARLQRMVDYYEPHTPDGQRYACLERAEAEIARLRAEVERLSSLLPDIERALVDLGACPVADCKEPGCLSVLARVRAAKRKDGVR